MKRILSVTGIMSLALLFLASFSLRENPQDPPRGKKAKKHIKMVKVDEDGKKVELDTIIQGENLFVWDGDTIAGGKELKWISKEDFDFDFETDFDFDFDFDVEVEAGEDGKVIIMKSLKGGSPIIKEFKLDGDSAKAIKIRMKKDGKHGDHDIMMWNSKDDNEMIFHAPHVVGVHAPKVMRIKKHKSGNVIDLTDPGIISFTKKDMKGGKEKITIIRNKPTEKDVELHEEIIMHGAEDHPKVEKKIKIIKGDDGKVQIFEDGNVWHSREGDKGNAKFITDDGKVIHLKETKEGDEIKMEVEIKEEKEEKQKEK